MKTIIKTIMLFAFSFLLFTFYFSLAVAQDIVFTKPKSLKVAIPTITIQGVVMDFDTNEIDIAVVNLLELVKEEEEISQEKKKKEQKKKKIKKRSWLETLEYETIRIRNSSFQKTIKIKEGINSIIAKPVDVKPTVQNIQMKVVILDKTSPRIEITEPAKDRIPYLKKISGRIKKKPYPKTVKITIEALSADGDSAEKEKKYRLDKLMEISVPVKRRKFSVPISVKEMLTGDEILIITVSADGIEITKTLF